MASKYLVNYGLRCLQLDFIQCSRMQDKAISLNTNTTKSPDLPCYDKGPTDWKAKNSSRIRMEFTMSSQHSSMLKGCQELHVHIVYTPKLLAFHSV